MTSKGKIDEALFRGATINTPSMLCVEDALFALKWARSIGGQKGLMSRSSANLNAISEWVKQDRLGGLSSKSFFYAFMHINLY